jgi:hypothetical protein
MLLRSSAYFEFETIKYAIRTTGSEIQGLDSNSNSCSGASGGRWRFDNASQWTAFVCKSAGGIREPRVCGRSRANGSAARNAASFECE